MLDHVERQFEPVLLLGIDGEIEVVGFRRLRQFQQDGAELGQHGLAVAGFVARVQRGQFDGNARAIGQGLVAGRTTDGGDGIGVGFRISARIVPSARAFAEHVVGMAVALRFQPARAFQRFADRFPQHELMPEKAHGLPHTLPHGGSTDALRHARQKAVRRVTRFHDAVGYAQPPCGSGDEPRIGGLHMAPVARADLVGDQCVLRRRIRHAQQGFGHDHQCQPFPGGQAVIAQKVFQSADGACLFANAFHQLGGACVDARFGGIAAHHPVDQVRHEGFVGWCVWCGEGSGHRYGHGGGPKGNVCRL